MKLGSIALAEFIVGMHGLTKVQRDPLAARLKHMHRMGFPLGKPPGRGNIASFGFEDVLQVALAFQLLETGTPTYRAVDLVRSNWNTVAVVALTLGWRAAIGGRSAGVLIALRPRAVVLLGQSDETLQAKAEKLNLVEVEGGFVRAGNDGVITFLDPVPIMRRLRIVLADAAATASTDVDDAFTELGTLVFGRSDPEKWEPAERAGR